MGLRMDNAMVIGFLKRNMGWLDDDLDLTMKLDWTHNGYWKWELDIDLGKCGSKLKWFNGNMKLDIENEIEKLVLKMD